MSTVEDLAIHAAMAASLSEFFERILSMEMETDEGDLLAVLEGEGFVGAVEVMGDLCGRLEIKLRSEFAVLMAASMLGGTVEDVDAEHEIPDLLSEMAHFLGRKLEENCAKTDIHCEVSKPEILARDDMLAFSAPLQRGSRQVFRHEDHEGWVDYRLDDAEAQGASEDDLPQGGGNSKGSAAGETDDGGEKSVKSAPVMVSDGEQDISLELEPLDGDGEGEDAQGFEGLSEEEEVSDLLLDNTVPGGESGAVSDGQADVPRDDGSLKSVGGGKSTPQKMAPDGAKTAAARRQVAKRKSPAKTPQKLDENGRYAKGLLDGFAAGNLHESEDGEIQSDDSLVRCQRRGPLWIAAAVLAAVAVGGWFFLSHRQPDPLPQPLATVDLRQENPMPAVARHPAAEISPQLPLAPAPEMTEASRLSQKLSDAQNLKEKLLGKLEEVLRLKQYFRDGIADLHSQVATWAQNSTMRTYQQAVQDRRVELDLRTIQRRLAAIDELNRPIDWLAHAAEEIDYGIRKTRIDLTMASYTAGADLNQLHNALEALTRQYALTDDRLLIDGQHVEARPLAVIWQEMTAPVKKVSWVEGAGGGTKKTFVDWAGSAANRRICQEICQGDFSHASDLTMISVEAATCLADDRVKDLFLSGLVELPGAAARNLAKWRGNWLVLNGLTSISPVAARQLAHWQGTRLSLNGVVALLPQAAVSLSKWKGRQLELMSLSATGAKTAHSVLAPLKKWETGERKLFVSPETRKVLDRL